jgi:hypothetical protein
MGIYVYESGIGTYILEKRYHSKLKMVTNNFKHKHFMRCTKEDQIFFSFEFWGPGGFLFCCSQCVPIKFPKDFAPQDVCNNTTFLHTLWPKLNFHI